MTDFSKQARPQKICKHCGRPFSWRKKWKKNWEQVIYCSKACREGRYPKKHIVAP